MRGTFFFVHGTGVRKEGYDKTWTTVQETARRNGFEGVSFVGCSWGETLGVPVDRFDPTLPPEVVTRDVTGATPLTEAELATATWELLVADPLFELRLAAESAPAASSGFVVGGLRADQAALAMVGAVETKAGALDLAGAGITARELADAAAAVSQSPELGGAAQAAGTAADPDLIDAAARAVVARVLSAHRLDPPGVAPAIALDGARRDVLVQQVAKAMAPAETRSLGGWIKKKTANFVARRATNIVLDRREGLMGVSLPALGDILFYQKRGETIGRFVAQALADLEPPVVAVGHSLGGIVLVDLLSRGGAPRVDLLVTAGSQSPLFYAIDALDQIRWGQPRPAPFMPWLNIYNRQDFLSFCASRIFSGTAGITDEEVDPGVPFPASHSAYWSHDRTYELIRRDWPR